MITITIAAAHPADLPAILALLERSGLPQDGLCAHDATAIVAQAGDTAVSI